MADEITVTIKLAATKGTVVVPPYSDTFEADWATARSDGMVQSIGTTHEALSIGADIATPGVLRLKNQDAINYIEVGRDVTGTFVPLIKLKPGETQLIRLAASAPPYAKANTAACDLEWLVLND